MELLGGEITMLKKQAIALLEKLDESPLVFYNPKNPQKSFIRKGSPIYMLVCFLAGIIAIPAALFFLFYL